LEEIRESNILRNNEFLLSIGLAPIQKQALKSIAHNKKRVKVDDSECRRSARLSGQSVSYSELVFLYLFYIHSYRLHMILK
jgi:hypothetical protein